MSRHRMRVLEPPGEGHPLLLRRVDAFALLTVPFLVLIFLVPARLVFMPLGAAGRPAVLFATGLGLVWLFAFLRRGGLPAGRQPVRLLVLVYLLVQVVTYAAGFDRGLPPAEARSADRWLLVSLAMVGMAGFVADAAPDRTALDRFLRRATAAGGAMAGVGALQFLVGLDLTQYMQLPGLGANRALIGIGERGDGFARIAGTASHYIEFGVVLGMLLPIAVHFALFAPPGARLRPWALVALLASAVPFSVSRSGVLAAATGLLVLSAVWPWRLRLNALVVALIGVCLYRLLQPGLLGTIRSLFTNAADDPSVQGRTDDYSIVFGFVGERPWLGRGAGTFMPERYILLDNQYLNTLVSQGLLGLAGLLLLLLGAYGIARRIRLRGADEETRHLGQALAAALMTGLLASATFDSLSFTSFTCLLFLLVGCAGALHRMDGGCRRPLQPAAEHDTRVASPWMAPTTREPDRSPA